jgi:hypothetical protein
MTDGSGRFVRVNILDRRLKAAAETCIQGETIKRVIVLFFAWRDELEEHIYTNTRTYIQGRAWGRASGATDLGPQIPGAPPHIPYRSTELVDYDYMQLCRLAPNLGTWRHINNTRETADGHSVNTHTR